MAVLPVSAVEFHDASLARFEYLRPQCLARLTILSFLSRDREAVEVDLEFRGVRYLLSTDLEPWGPSDRIYSGAWGERPAIAGSGESGWELGEHSNLLHLVLQSGDEIYIACEQVVACAVDRPAANSSRTHSDGDLGEAPAPECERTQR